MKVTFITNACALYESQGFRLLADPWLSESCFDGSWWHDPPIRSKPQDFLDVDALYISHIHQDHCDPETLRHFRRDIPIITLKDKHSFCLKHLEKMGFTKVSGLEDRQSQLVIQTIQREDGSQYCRGIGVTMFGPFTTHPFHATDCELGNVVDSALLIKADGQSVLNCNDNTLTIEKAHWFRETYGAPTLAQLNWNAAGPYPACFINLTIEEKHAESKRIVHRQLGHMADVGRALQAKVVQPFAGAFRLGGSPEKEAMNAYNGTCSAWEAATYLAWDGVPWVCPKEGEVIDLGAY